MGPPLQEGKPTAILTTTHVGRTQMDKYPGAGEGGMGSSGDEGFPPPPEEDLEPFLKLQWLCTPMLVPAAFLGSKRCSPCHLHHPSFLLLGVWVCFLVIMITVVECGRPEMFSLLTDSGLIKPVPPFSLLAQMAHHLLSPERVSQRKDWWQPDQADIIAIGHPCNSWLSGVPLWGWCLFIGTVILFAWQDPDAAC